MDDGRTELASTTGLCPACLDQVPGRYEAVEGAVYLTRECDDHGTTSRRVWGSVDHWEWAASFGPATDGDPVARDHSDSDECHEPTAPSVGDCCEPAGDASTADADCCAPATASTGDGDGGFRVESDHACLAVVEVTQDCNLSCSYCFAGSGPGGHQRSREAVIDLLDVIRDAGGPRPVQFSGGEPTVRDDLPGIVETAAEMGFEHVQVNTNGLRLAREDGYADRLAAAGVTAVYLQFDGLDPGTYEAIREVDLVAEKHAAIDACRAADLPVVLVPTVVPGVNDDEMGDVVRFALDNLDVIESVNFQPVAHFGRYGPDDGRFPLDVAADRLAAQVDGLEKRDLVPIPCCSSHCQMATALVPGDGAPVPVTQFVDDALFETLSGVVDEADWMELLANTPAGRDRACSAVGCCDFDLPAGAGDLFADLLPVSLTGFMDADAGDADRLSNCCISVPTPDGELVPFCGYNMTTDDGRYALRNRHDWGGRPAVGEPVDAASPEGGESDD
ncbi:MAG: radical SAM protein [Halobacteriaceae archaeon]